MHAIRIYSMMLAMTLALAACAIQPPDKPLVTQINAEDSTHHLILRPSHGEEMESTVREQMSFMDYLSGPAVDHAIIETAPDTREVPLSLVITRELRAHSMQSTDIEILTNPQLKRDEAVLHLRTLTATGPECPGWWMDPTSNYNNWPMPGVGCATQRNLAAMAIDPADLENGRGELSPDAERNSIVMQAHRSNITVEATVSGTQSSSSSTSNSTSSGSTGGGATP